MQERVVRVDGPVACKEVSFSPPALAGVAWPVIEIAADAAGPRLCVMAGMHVNEVCSMEAAVRLPAVLAGAMRRGSVHVMPVVNLPALWQRTVQLCPVDDRNLNFAFPGDAAGSFTPSLAHALLHEWAADADLLIDMHGGDLQTQVSHFVMCQMTGRRAFDERSRAFARCFDADIIVEFAEGQKDNHGRACNARPELGRHAVMSEGGSNGLLREDDVRFHLDGVLNCAALLGIIDGPVRPPQRRQQRVSGFHRLAPPRNARTYPRVRASQHVHAGDVLADLRDIWGQPIGALTAPASGPVVFCLSHPIVAADEVAIGVGQPID
jgi:predicted deacylase